MSEATEATDEGLLAVHSLDHFRLEVPDLGDAERFYRAFGLLVSSEDGGLAVRTFGSDHVWLRIMAGPRKKLAGLTFGIFESDLPRFARRLQSRPNSLSLFTETPDGLPIELAVGPKTTVDEKSSFLIADAGASGRGALSRSAVGVTRPRRLAHITLFTSDVQKTIDFYEDVLGLRLSDRSGNDVAFLHAPHGSDHHLVALARSDGTGMHHCSWDVGSLSEVGQGAMQMADAGYSAGWGMGRHVLGSNYFHYVRDPWGSYSEYSADMDFIPAGTVWKSGDHPGEDSFYQWGPTPPEDFVVNHELEAR